MVVPVAGMMRSTALTSTNSSVSSVPMVLRWPARACLAFAGCESARGPDTDRHGKHLFRLRIPGSVHDAYSHLDAGGEGRPCPPRSYRERDHRARLISGGLGVRRNFDPEFRILPKPDVGLGPDGCDARRRRRPSTPATQPGAARGAAVGRIKTRASRATG
jgi:hypothetical protein